MSNEYINPYDINATRTAERLARGGNRSFGSTPEQRAGLDPNYIPGRGNVSSRDAMTSLTPEAKWRESFGTKMQPSAFFVNPHDSISSTTSTPAAAGTPATRSIAGNYGSGTATFYRPGQAPQIASTGRIVDETGDRTDQFTQDPDYLARFHAAHGRAFNPNNAADQHLMAGIAPSYTPPAQTAHVSAPLPTFPPPSPQALSRNFVATHPNWNPALAHNDITGRVPPSPQVQINPVEHPPQMAVPPQVRFAPNLSLATPAADQQILVPPSKRFSPYADISRLPQRRRAY